MNEIVDVLKEEKEQTEYKLQQYDNLIKCQKVEIESKCSLLRQFELVGLLFLNIINNEFMVYYIYYSRKIKI